MAWMDQYHMLIEGKDANTEVKLHSRRISRVVEPQVGMSDGMVRFITCA